jgi:Reverse transcriptase (RNA-dependent DNA polymerase)
MAQSFSQVPEVDYFDTYAPVAKLTSIRSILAMGAELDMEMHQIDIKGAYLNGKLTPGEVIYMKQPPSYAEPNSAGKVCHLKKTLYSLKQSGRRWYQKLVFILVDNLGFTCCNVDQAIFFRRKDNDLTVIAIHVDNCTLAATSVTLIQGVKDGICNFVEISNLGELHWLLGIKIKRDWQARTIHLSQRSYLESTL